MRILTDAVQTVIQLLHKLKRVDRQNESLRQRTECLEQDLETSRQENEELMNETRKNFETHCADLISEVGVKR